MIFSENRFPPRIKSGAGFFGIMRARSAHGHGFSFFISNDVISPVMVKSV
jgi:hypothetical protein